MKLKKGGYYLPVAACGALVVLGGAVVVSSCIDPVKAKEQTSSISPSQYSVSIASINTVTMNLETVPDTNVVRSGKDTITTTITAPPSTASQFKLYLSTDSATSNSLTNGTDNIIAGSGTVESPAKLVDNSWGFALANTTAGLPTNGFDASYAIPNPTKESKWAAVPKKGQEQLLQTLPMNQASTTTDVYYGVSAKNNISEGTYAGSVVYTAIYNAAETAEASLSPTSGTTGDTVTLTTAAKLDPNLDDLGTAEIYFTGSSGTPVLADDITITKTADGLIQVTGKVPELTDGNYTVTVKLSKNNTTYTADSQFAYTAPGPTPEPGGCTTPFPDGIIYMQDLTPQAKADMTQNTEYVLTDKRDGKSYCVAKLNDGNIWMTDSLRLDLSDSKALTPFNSDVETDWTPLRSTVMNKSEFTIDPYSPSSWRIWDESYYVSDWDNRTYTSPSECINGGHYSMRSQTECRHLRVGSFYNFSAAVASNDTSEYITGGYDMPNSICPKGWRLPSANTAVPSEFGTMLFDQGRITDASGDGKIYKSGGWSSMRMNLPHWTSAGWIDLNKNWANSGVEGKYWSRTVKDDSFGYSASYSATNESYSQMHPRYGSYRSGGSSIRCIAR